MADDLFINDDVTIPSHELAIEASRAGGPGGQHVNKTSTRITVRWNLLRTTALSDQQKERVVQKLQNQITSDGDLVIHRSTSRSQQQNKQDALKGLALLIRKALLIPKKRIPTRVSKSAQESRLHAKTERGAIKKMRSKKIEHD